MTAKPRLSWKQEPREKGLAGSVQGQRGFILSYGGVAVGRVRPKTNGINTWIVQGWYWTARSETLRIPLRNTAGELVETAEEAKEQCAAYVRHHLSYSQTPPLKKEGE